MRDETTDEVARQTERRPEETSAVVEEDMDEGLALELVACNDEIGARLPVDVTDGERHRVEAHVHGLRRVARGVVRLQDDDAALGAVRSEDHLTPPIAVEVRRCDGGVQGGIGQRV